ncbi:MAG TPA: Ig-like domain-containing protein, partial [Pyrinomonadaceae bacterium]
MKVKRPLFALILLLSAQAALHAATTIGVNFQGRDNNSNPTPALGAGDTAGLVPQGNWNNVNDKATTPAAENGVTGPLNDSTGAATAVTLTFAAQDSWNNDVVPGTVTTGNAKLMNGIIKANGADAAATFTFDNLPAGTYDIYMYMNENGNGALADVTDGTTTYYVTETHQFVDTDSFKQAKNTTDPATGGTRDLGNYVKFTGISGASKTITVTHRVDPSNNDGAGIAGFQIVSPSGATPVSIGYQPQAQTTTVGKAVTFSVVVNGPYTSVQWQKKAVGGSFTDIPGATSLSYTTPSLVASDDGALYHAIIGSASGPITSADAKVTVNNDTTSPTLRSASGTLTKVRLVFSEPLDLTTATAKANYSIDKGVTISSATSEEVGTGNAEVTVVTLNVTGATAGTAYTVTVNGIKDAAGNVIAANTTKSFFLYQQVVSVNFQGRDNDGTATDPLNAAEIAGLVSATSWNNIDDNAVGNNGTSGPLVDSTGAATPITVTFSAQDSWNNDTDPASIKTGSARMMNGIIKVGDPNGATGGQAVFTFDNLPAGGYDVYVYMNENGDGTQLNVDDGTTTFYVIETHQFTDTSRFIQAQNTTDPDTGGGTRDVGNYVKFTGETATSLTITATHILNSDGCGIAGFQIVQPSGPTLYPPATITITAQPQPITVTEGRQGSLSVTATTTSDYGLTYQWKKAGVAIPGATSSTYKLPVQQLSDNGTQYTVDISTLGASTVTSSPVTVTVIADKVPPQLLSAGSLKTFAGGNEVDLIFDETLAPSSVSPLSNFTLTGGAAVTAARIVTNSSGLDTTQAGIILTATGITPGTSYTVTVKGVSDTHNNPITTPQTMTFTASPFGWVSLEGLTVPNSGENDALAIGTNSFNLVNGGNAFWGTEDDITMVYEKVTGDFDRQVQVDWNDPSSNWARAGISARESLNNGQPTTDAAGDNPASRYQMVLSDPMTKFDGTAANDGWESNRRVDTGGITSALNGIANVVVYPNSYLRLKRVGDRISVFYSTDFKTWHTLGTTDYGDDTVTASGPLAADLFVGPTMGAENGNILSQGGTADQTGAFASRFRNYGPIVQKPLGTEAYSIGLNLGANEGGAQLSPTDVAGVDQIAQANWNNIFGNDTTVTPAGPVVANNGSATPVTVDISGSGNTWASQGPRGENNSLMTGNDAILMTGYLDTGAATTTKVQISNIPSNLTTPGYDVVVYALGGVGNKGGSYRVTDA